MRRRSCTTIILWQHEDDDGARVTAATFFLITSSANKHHQPHRVEPSYYRSLILDLRTAIPTQQQQQQQQQQRLHRTIGKYMHLIESYAAFSSISAGGSLTTTPLPNQNSSNRNNPQAPNNNILGRSNFIGRTPQSQSQSHPIIRQQRQKSSISSSTRKKMPTTTTSTTSSANDVLLYVPNLIGYARVAFTITSLVLMLVFPHHHDNKEHTYYWVVATALYIASFVGDLFDGMVARKLHQTSTFGGLLDMVTDRCSTLGLLFVLAISYKDQVILQLTFLFLALLDISSHWCQMYSTSALGKHHKSEDGNEGRHFLVRWFYKYYYFFGYLCVGAEFTYVIAYVLQFTQGMAEVHALLTWTLWLVIPGCIMKQLVNVMQLSSACYAVAQYDADMKNK